MHAYVSSYLQTKTLHKNEIVQLLHIYKCHGVDQSRFKKPLQSSATKVKNNYSEKTCPFSPDVQFVTSLKL